MFALLLPAAGLCLMLAGCAAEARTGPEIAEVFNRGLAAYDAGHYEDAFKIWWDLQFEDVAAMRNVAMMLRKGQGVARDPAKALAEALPFLEAAAAAGHPVAQFQLGELYETGAPPLVPQNLEVARQLYANAARHGMKEAAARAALLGPPAVAAQPPASPAKTPAAP
jgi:TPR repeat protein